MKALFEKYKDFIMEVIHFGMVGVINTFLGWVIMAVLYNLIHMNYWLSSGISYFYWQRLLLSRERKADL